MSVTTTLNEMQKIVKTEMPYLNVRTTTPTIPFAGPYPAIVFTEFRQVVQRQFTGMRGNDGFRPNQYSFVYVQQALSESRVTIEVAVAELRANIERFVAIWDNPNYAQLNGIAVRAGDVITIEYDRQGNFIEYLGKQHIGCFGGIEVWENYRPDQIE